MQPQVVTTYKAHTKCISIERRNVLNKPHTTLNYKKRNATYLTGIAVPTNKMEKEFSQRRQITLRN